MLAHLVLPAAALQAVFPSEPLVEMEDHRGTLPQGDPCACLNYQGVYQYKLANCGEGNELYFDTGNMGGAESSVNERMAFSKAISAWGHEVCMRFYRQLNTTACTNIANTYLEDSWDNAQWCYVPHRCNDLNGGLELNEHEGQDTHLSWKICRAGEDELMSSYTVDQLKQISKILDVEATVLARAAYFTWDDNPWEDVRAFFYPEEEDKDFPLDEEVRERLGKALGANKQLIFYQADQKYATPFYIGTADRVYRVQDGRNKMDIHRYTWYNLKCIKGPPGSGCTEDCTDDCTENEKQGFEIQAIEPEW